MDMKLFISTFILIAVAELPDKTSFATILMATKNNIWSVFIGVCAAFLVQSIVAVTFGSALTYFPEKWIHLVSGILFLVFAVLALRRKEDEEAQEEESKENQVFNWRGVWSSFLVIFIAEWGDLTQLATASLQARYNSPLTILLASTLALWCVTGLAIFVGSRAKQFFKPALLNRIAAGAFALVGFYLISSWFFVA